MVPIEQIGHSILSQGNDHLVRCGSWHIYQHRARAAQVNIAVVKLSPVRGSEIIRKISAEFRSHAQTNNRFSSHPRPGTEGIAGRRENGGDSDEGDRGSGLMVISVPGSM
jgi:hypothetical protein